jgi:hypothetical protein
MNRFILALLVAVLALTACGSEQLSGAYTAAGDGNRPDDLTKTATFRADDDLNVVVTLSPHTRTLPVYAIFTAPNGNAYATDALDADETVGKVLLGLDWDAQGNVSWPVGDWHVDVYVDNERQDTLRFTVEPVDVTVN